MIATAATIPIPISISTMCDVRNSLKECFEDMCSCWQWWWWNEDGLIKSAGSHHAFVDEIRAIGGGHHHHTTTTRELMKTIEL